MSKETEAVVQMTASDFAKSMEAVMLSVLEHARKPVLTEQQVREMEARQEERKENAEKERQRMENLRRVRRACNHMRRDGSCRAVFVKGCGDPNLADGTGSGNFFICQACQAIVRPGVAPEGYTGMDIFDNVLFEKLWQATAEVAGGVLY